MVVRNAGREVQIRLEGALENAVASYVLHMHHSGFMYLT